MLASRCVGTSDKWMLSMCAMQALKEVSLLSPNEATLLLPSRDSTAAGTLAVEKE
jgi:hypothetical protein